MGARHGGLEVVRDGRRLLRRVRGTGHRQGQRRRAWRAGGSLAQPRVHRGGRLRPADEAKEKNYSLKKLSGTKFRQMLRAGEDIPEWFAFKSVVEVLRAEWK